MLILCNLHKEIFNLKPNFMQKTFTLITLLLLTATNMQLKAQATAIRTGVSFEWQGVQNNGNESANLKSITIGTKIHDQFIMPTGYQLDQVGPDGHINNNIRENNVVVLNNSTSTTWNTKALAAFRSNNLNYIFQCDNNGREICGNYTAATTTDAQKQSLLYAQPVKVTPGTIIAVAERNGNNCFYVNVFGTVNGTGTETLLGNFFIQSNVSLSLWGFNVNPPVTGSDYWQSGRIEGNGGSMGIAVFDLTTIAPLNSYISRIQLVASTADHGDGKVFISQTLAALLNVKFQSFAAQKVGTTTSLNFIVSEAATQSKFTIERSTDGLNFTTLNTINGTTATNYTYIDNTPILTGKNYYRIKQIDNKGTITYSDIRMVKFAKDNKIEIYPIPAVNTLNISFDGNTTSNDMVISIRNVQGQELMRKKINNAATSNAVDVSSLASGTYVLRISNQNEIITEKKIVITK
jgi:Secretion system C-terminal sorting domain